MTPIHRGGEAGLPRRTITPTFRSRTCRSACSRHPAARPAAASPSGTTSSISPRRSNSDCSTVSLRNAARAASGATLNPVFALGRDARLALRRRLGEILDADGPDRRRYEALRSRLIHRADACRLELPATIGDYTDFFAGIHHATNAGKLFRPDNPLLPNYKYVPIGYHGRASSIRPSGADVRRPNGQRKPAAEIRSELRPLAQPRL